MPTATDDLVSSFQNELSGSSPKPATSAPPTPKKTSKSKNVVADFTAELAGNAGKTDNSGNVAYKLQTPSSPQTPPTPSALQPPGVYSYDLDTGKSTRDDEPPNEPQSPAPSAAAPNFGVVQDWLNKQQTLEQQHAAESHISPFAVPAMPSTGTAPYPQAPAKVISSSTSPDAEAFQRTADFVEQHAGEPIADVGKLYDAYTEGVPEPPPSAQEQQALASIPPDFKAQVDAFSQSHPFLASIPEKAKVVKGALGYGLAHSVGAATSPESLATLGAFMLSPETRAVGIVKRLVSLGWSLEQANDAAQQLSAAYDAHLKGDDVASGKLLGTGLANTAMAVLGGAYAGRPGAKAAAIPEGDAAVAPGVPTLPSMAEPEGVGPEDLFEQPPEPANRTAAQPAATAQRPQAIQRATREEHKPDLINAFTNELEAQNPVHYAHPVTGVDTTISPDELDSGAWSLYGRENFSDLKDTEKANVVRQMTPTTTGQSFAAEQQARQQEALSNLKEVGPDEESLAAESPETLQAQTDALADGTNEVVYIPKGQEDEAPEPPENAEVTNVPGEGPGAGLYYHTPEVTAQEIKEAAANGDHGKLLGMVQDKDEAIASKHPLAVVARDEDGTELKTALVDGDDPDVVEAQKEEFKKQFPKAASVEAEEPAKVLTERGAARAEEAKAEVEPEKTLPENLRPAEEPTAAPIEKVKAQPFQKQLAQLYINRIRKNPMKRGYAQDYLKARLRGSKTPDTRGLSFDDASSVRSNIDTLLKAEKSIPPEKLFKPETIKMAESLVDHAAAFLSDNYITKPGRYVIDAEKMGELGEARGRNQVYGVGSLRRQFPWFADMRETPKQLADAVKRGKGPTYDRLIQAAADYWEKRQAQAKPILDEYGPQARELAHQIRDTDPELAEGLDRIADGLFPEYDSLDQFARKVQDELHDARAAAQFSQSVNELAEHEARESYPDRESLQEGAEEAPRTSEETRREEEVKPPVTASVKGQEGILPGTEQAVAEQKSAAQAEQGRKLTEQFNRAPESIESRAGEMETKSPLFRGTEASPQNEMFGGQAPAAELRTEAEIDPERERLLARLRELEEAARRKAKAEAPGASNVDTLRRAADSLNAPIEAKKNPAIANQNPTARRAHIAEGMYQEAQSMEKTQRVLRGMADAAEAGELPESLANVRSRALVEDLLRRDRPPRAILRAHDIRDLIEKTKSHPGLAEQRRILSRAYGRGDMPELHGMEEINAAEKIMAVAEERGLRTKYMGDGIKDYKRAHAAGLADPQKWAEARKAILEYTGAEKPKGVEHQIREAERALIGTKIEGYFPTPKTLAARLVDMADIKPGDDVLEPSAGSGSIADAIRDKSPDATLDTAETSDRLRKILELKGHNVAARDFLEHEDKYDKIVMNPPFEGGQDIEHVRHAYDLLKPGGKLVAIMSEGPFFRNDAKAAGFRNWLDSVGGESEKLPEGSFTGKESQRQTGVAARAVTIEKPEGRNPERGAVTTGMLRDIASGRIAKEAGKAITDNVLKLQDKYNAIRKADPSMADRLQELDNAYTYYNAKAEANLKKVVGNLSRPQERLAALMADQDSRENLRLNHPDEYDKAIHDPAVMKAVDAYKPLAQELTDLRQSRGGAVLDRDYLRRVYEERTSGVSHENAPKSEKPVVPFDRVIRPTKPDKFSREASAEYFHEHGLHEFGPSYATKYVGEKIAALRTDIAKSFMGKATRIASDEEMPRSIDYNSKTYYRPDIASQMVKPSALPKQFQKNVYAVYDPNAGIRTAIVDSDSGDVTFGKSAYKYLGPKDIVDKMRDYDTSNMLGPQGSLRTFFRQQIIGFGFGVPHIANIERRVMQSFHGGVANPHSWAAAWKVAFDRGLKERALSGVDDPRYDALLKQGGMSAGEIRTYKQYAGGNWNPLNWAKFGHDLIFKPGGIDQRARVYVGDLVKQRNPDLSDAEIAREINTQLGDYNRRNWTDRQKLLSKFMLFPGWDTSSISWVLRHPLRTAVPPAMLVLLANQVSNKLGGNQGEDQYDISAVHVGNRAYSPALVREPLARAFYRPLLNFAQSKIRGESNTKAAGEAGRGVNEIASSIVGTLDPRISGIAALAANKQNFFGGKEIVSKNDDETPGKILPTLGLEKRAAFIARQFFPGINRAIDTNQDIDPRSFVGGNLGLPNYKSDAASRLARNAGEASRAYSVLDGLAKRDPAEAREYLKDPDNAVLALFHNDFSQFSTAVRKIDAAKQSIGDSKLPSAEKDKRTKALDTVREEILKRADVLDVALFKAKRQLRAKADERPTTPSFMAKENVAPVGAPAQ